jgi:hypothetical protein
VNGLKLYYEIHGAEELLALLADRKKGCVASLFNVGTVSGAIRSAWAGLSAAFMLIHS